VLVGGEIRGFGSEAVGVGIAVRLLENGRLKSDIQVTNVIVVQFFWKSARMR
jgi:hypothetical protein